MITKAEQRVLHELYIYITDMSCGCWRYSSKNKGTENITEEFDSEMLKILRTFKEAT